MLELIFNPLSLSNQCANDDDAKISIKNVLDCLDHIEYLWINGGGVVYFDERIEERSIGPKDSYGVAISKLMNTPNSQLARKWYIYRKRFRRIGPPDRNVVITSGDGSCIDSVSGDISEKIFSSGLAAVSFGGSPLMESKSLAISSGDVNSKIINHHRATSLKESLPFYKASPKHRAKKYFDRVRKEWVAPMTLPSDLAQQVLSLAFRHESDYFGYHAASEKIIRFKLTVGTEYHGFEIEASELPNEARAALFPDK